MSTLVAPVTTAVTNAEAGTSKLTTELQTMKGETGLTQKHLYNNLLEIPGGSILILNPVTGDNACCALYENTCTVTTVDDVTCTPTNFAALTANVELFKGNSTVHLIDSDWSVADVSGTPTFNIFAYQASMEAGRVASALYRYEKKLASEFVMVISQWQETQTQGAVEGFIADMRMTVEYSAVLDNVYVAVVKKTRIQY